MSEGARAACVIGWPVKHSRSPLIHGYWIKQHGLDGGIPARGDRAGGVRGFHSPISSARGYVGANITLPHKEAALAAVGAGRSRARGRRRQHAVARRRAAAFDQHRRRRLHRQSRRRGAGLGRTGRRGRRARRRRLGARRGLWPDRARLRQDPRGQPHARSGPRRCASASARRCSRRNWTALPHLLARAGLLVNTTSLGMTGQPPLEIDLAPLPGDAVVADLVYAPLETPLLAAARSARARHRRRARHAAASGGAGLSAVVRGAAGGDAGAAGPGRGRPRAAEGNKPCQAGGFTAGPTAFRRAGARPRRGFQGG